MFQVVLSIKYLSSSIKYLSILIPRSCMLSVSSVS